MKKDYVKAKLEEIKSGLYHDIKMLDNLKDMVDEGSILEGDAISSLLTIAHNSSIRYNAAASVLVMRSSNQLED